MPRCDLVIAALCVMVGCGDKERVRLATTECRTQYEAAREWIREHNVYTFSRIRTRGQKERDKELWRTWMRFFDANPLAVDPWEAPYYYKIGPHDLDDSTLAGSLRVCSAGPDQQQCTSDDIMYPPD